MMFRFGCLQSGPHTMVINGLKKPLKKLPYKWVTVGIFHPDKWSSGSLLKKPGFFGPHFIL